MGLCCFKQAQTRSYSTSIEKPLSEFQHNQSTTPTSSNPSIRPTSGLDSSSKSSCNSNHLQFLDSTSEESRFSNGITKFNITPKEGILFLQKEKLIGVTPTNVADFLSSRRIFRGRTQLQSGLNKKKLGEYLGRYGKTEIDKEFHRQLLIEFMKKTSVSNLDLDVALRKCLETFLLAGEAAVIDRVIQGFADWYHVSNPGTFQHSDTAHVLAFGVIMLNTDAHNKQVKHKMTEQQFQNIMKGIDQGKNMNEKMLSNIYKRTVANAFELDQHEHEVVTFFNANREGWLWKKSSSRWRKRWFLINNHCLYYFKQKPKVGLDNTSTCKCVIPLENLNVKLKSNGKFSLYPSRKGKKLKTAKRNNKGNLVQGKNTKMTLRAENKTTAKLWTSCIQMEMAPNPFLLHLQTLGVEHQLDDEQQPDVKEGSGDGRQEREGENNGRNKSKSIGSIGSSKDDYMRDDGQLVTDSELESDDENDFGRDDGDDNDDDDSSSDEEEHVGGGVENNDGDVKEETKEELIGNEQIGMKVEDRQDKQENAKQDLQQDLQQDVQQDVQQGVKQEDVKQDTRMNEKSISNISEETTTEKKTNGTKETNLQVEKVENEDDKEEEEEKKNEEEANDEMDDEVVQLTSLQIDVMKRNDRSDSRSSDGERMGRSPTISISDESTILTLGKLNSSSSSRRSED